MKLNWFSPLPPARTDIAHYTARVLPALSQLAEVTLWTEQREWDRSLEDQATVRSFRLERMPWSELNRADACIYQIGNNPLFHGAIWQVSRLHAGVVVLHDFSLHHFFDGLYRVKWRDLESYQAVMETYYGEEGRRDAAESYHNEARNIGYMAERYPLTRLAVEHALGVVTHTPASLVELSQDAPWPIVFAPLPFAIDTIPPKPETRDMEPPYRLIVFGYIGRNRRLESILQALAELPERAAFQVDIYGEILDGEERLRAQLRSLDLKRQVTLHGFTSEKKLDEALSQAHLAINLRYPTMGEASGSQLRIWAHALPSLVSQVGWYATLPPDTVRFVRPDTNEVADIQWCLQSYLADRAGFAAMGERGRKLLEERHSCAEYARTIIEISQRAEKFRARAASLKLAERAGVLLSEWLGQNAFGELGANVAEEILQFAER
jgi:glycosyltransferase involved in cell wall biosynthesis